jgi:ATP adenylyltransferase
MEQLWAPWRLEYVSKVDEPGGCFLCEAAAADPEDPHNLLVSRSERSLCILNRFPYNNGHLLVAPIEHRGDFDRLPESDVLDIHRLLAQALDALSRTMRPQGFNVGLNLGRPAGAGVPGHLHWHVVPRWSGDTNFMPVLADVKIIPQALRRTRDMLRQALRQPPHSPRSPQPPEEA